MPESLDIQRLVDRFLDHHALFFPVDATFMGLNGANHRLPPVGTDVAVRERDGLRGLNRALAALPSMDLTRHERLDARLMQAALTHAEAALDCWPRFHQPSWYSGEAAFAVISLLLPSAPADAADALPARLAAMAEFLDTASATLAGAATPRDWCERARRECVALQRLLTTTIRRHPIWHAEWEPVCAQAARAAQRFSATIGALPDRAPECGRDYLAFLMRDVHGLPWSPEDALALARDAFARLDDAIKRRSRTITPAATIIAPEALPAAYRNWHDRALAAAGNLVTPEPTYTLEFHQLPDWARDIAGALYFLSYRSPPALAAGSGSTYWTAPVPQPLAAIKQTHAVHHGSVGHHTQNARARTARSRLARLGGTDCASGIAFLSAGTMVEGWACYATELMAECSGFYTSEEELALLYADRRNAASVIADISLHCGAWSLEQMRAFYRDEAGFPAPRIWSETTRNSIHPATRLMYFLGTEQIKALRREIDAPARELHDALLSHGHVPVAWAADEVRGAPLSQAP